METTDKPERFVKLLTENQNRIFSYVFSLICDHTRAADVVQETNLALWRKIDEFDPDRPFLPWAFAFARNQVLANIRNKGREQVLVDAELVELMSEDVADESSQLESTRNFLKSCIQNLSTSSRHILEERYFSEKSIPELSSSLGKSAGAVKVALLRIRQQLAYCIQRSLAKES